MKSKATLEANTIAVIGAGPVGCTLAAFLARGGAKVILCDINPDLVNPALDPGITIEGAENLRQPVSAICTRVDELAPYRPSVIFLTVKASAIPLIASAIESFYQKGQLVVSWQNGIDTEAEIARVLGRMPVLRAVVNYGCGLIQPGRVRLVFHHPPHYLQELAPETRPAARALAETLTRSGLTTEHTDQIVPLVWRKAVMNACMNPVCAVTGQTMQQALEDPIIVQLIDSLLKECIRVARANEIALGWDYYAFARDYMEKAGPHKPSMLMDVEQGRRTEIDFINGKFIEYGRQAGIETPFNTTIRALVKALESRPGS
ncbi:MAG: 2-dehydropantoate 2-reductase [Deltaproteobacteria bacterium]|nr:2-dehydropantoate 2-reductase [Deltaproteobacteria bacterium]